MRSLALQPLRVLAMALLVCCSTNNAFVQANSPHDNNDISINSIDGDDTMSVSMSPTGEQALLDEDSVVVVDDEEMPTRRQGLVVESGGMQMSEEESQLLDKLVAAIEANENVEEVASLASQLAQTERFGKKDEDVIVVSDDIPARLLGTAVFEHKHNALRGLLQGMPHILDSYCPKPHHTQQVLTKSPLGSCITGGDHTCVSILLSHPTCYNNLREDFAAVHWSGWSEFLLHSLKAWASNVWTGDKRPNYPWQDYDESTKILMNIAVEKGSESVLHVNHLFHILEDRNYLALKNLIALSPRLPRVFATEQRKRPLHLIADTRSVTISIAKMLTGHQQGRYQGPEDDSVPPFDSCDAVGLQKIREVLKSENTTFVREDLDKHVQAWNLHFAIMLLNAKSTPFARDNSFNTVLHVAAEADNAPLIELLLQHFGAEKMNLNERNAEGQSALSLARFYGNTASQRALLKFNATWEEEIDGPEDCTPDNDGYCLRHLQPPISTRKPRSPPSPPSSPPLPSSSSPPSSPPSPPAEVDPTVGGWDPTRDPTVDISFCDFDVRFDLDDQELLREYVRKRKPVVLRDRESLGWSAFREWTREKWTNEVGDVEFRVYEKHGTGKPRSFPMKLRDYIKYMETEGRNTNEVLWMHDTQWPKGMEDFFNSQVGNFTVINDALHGTTPIPQINNFQFMISPRLSGSPPHFHFTAANLLLYGRKRWFLFPPNKSFYSTVHTTRWLQTDYPNLLQTNPPFECIQEPGDLIYLPSGWGHATVAVQDTIAFAYLYNTGYM